MSALPSKMVLCAVALAAGCADPRPVGDGSACLTWEGDVASLMQSRCASCHAGASPAGGYDVSSYLGALGRSVDGGAPTSDGGAALEAGNARSRALVTIDPASATAPHTGFADVYAALTRWDVDCSLAIAATPVHPHGIADPGQPSDFHATLVAQQGYNLSFCAGCHGSDFSGGAAGGSCTTCHAQGPTACNTCHGQPPDEGAHLAHTSGAILGKKLDCSECHVKPQAYTDSGHIFDQNGQVKSGAATVTFGALAAKSTSDRKGPPSFDGTTCANVYCHGGAFNDPAARDPAPHWGEKGAADCGGCHGTPPSGKHPAVKECSICHRGVVDDTGAIVDQARHLDGMTDVVDVTDTSCTGCHGGAAGNPAPPRDLHGNTATSFVTVGAHQAHLKAAQGITAPIACAECHLVPQHFDDPGHVDHDQPAAVFPTGAGTIARADSAAPTWDRTTARCANVYCHGGGKSLAADTSSSKKPTPLWTGGVAEAECGACHGIPPKDSTHDASMTLSTCGNAGCHPNTVSASGNILVTNGQSRHINGVVDAP